MKSVAEVDRQGFRGDCEMKIEAEDPPMEGIEYVSKSNQS